MRYRDLPYSEKEKIVSLVFEEAKRMKKDGKRVNYHELSRAIFAKTGIAIHYSTIRRWFTGEHTPLRIKECKASRQPPDEDAQIVRGLEMTDLTRKDSSNTIELYLGTTKDFFAQRVRRFLSKYGWTDIKPKLIGNKPEWKMTAYLDYGAWVHEFEKSVEKLTYEEKIKLLSGVISGDGAVTLNNTHVRTVSFVIVVVTAKKHKVEMYHQILESMSIPHGVTQGRLLYNVNVGAKNAVKYLLTNLRLLQPFREVKRILALRFIEKDMRDRDLVKPVWEYLRVLEKHSTIRSQIRACKLIPDEEFDKKRLSKQWMLKQLRRKLYKYADMVRELKPTATKIISDLRPPLTSSFSFGLFHVPSGYHSCLGVLGRRIRLVGHMPGMRPLHASLEVLKHEKKLRGL